jgi:hypothetical protein
MLPAPGVQYRQVDPANDTVHCQSLDFRAHSRT